MRTCLDIFTGLSGFSLAAKANGVQTVAMCEREPFLRDGLARAWPGVKLYDDIKTFNATEYRGVWLVAGGPPCQPASRAGQQRGTKDDRWLWGEAIRIVAESEPTWFLFENPPGILDVGLDGILVDLERLGYEVQPLSIPACAVNSPQDRERIWILGHRERINGRLQLQPGRPRVTRDEPSGPTQVGAVADSDRDGYNRAKGIEAISRFHGTNDGLSFGGAWQDFEWLECPDQKRGTVIRRIPTGLYDLAARVHARIPRKFRAKLIAALGNAIVHQVATEIISAMIQSEYQKQSCITSDGVRNGPKDS